MVLVDGGAAAQPQHEGVVLPQHQVAVRCGAQVHGDARAVIRLLHPLHRADHAVGGRVVDDVGVAAHAVQGEHDGAVVLLHEVRRAGTDRDDDVHTERRTAHLHVGHHAARRGVGVGEDARFGGVHEQVEVHVHPHAVEATVATDERNHGTRREEPLVRPAGDGAAIDDTGGVVGGGGLADLDEPDGAVRLQRRGQGVEARGECGDGVGARGRERFRLGMRS
jgi:hypothetical protein